MLDLPIVVAVLQPGFHALLDALACDLLGDIGGQAVPVIIVALAVITPYFQELVAAVAMS